MSNVSLRFTELEKYGVWKDYRNNYPGGFGWRGDRALSNVEHLVIHHSVTTKTRNADNDIAKIAAEHIDVRKWGGIGYNIVITSEERNGYAVVGYVGDMGSIRAHTPNLKGVFGIPARQGNVYLAGICIVGDFRDQTPSEAQLRSVHRVCHDLIYADGRFPKLKSWDNLRMHKDFDATACPGDFAAYRQLIIDPPKPEVASLSEYESVLKAAKDWNEAVGAKYGEKILGRVDDSNLSRNDLLIALYRYTQYLRRSPVV
ncbi:N-acetylmuramoyl-L-alanine amidase [Candidatus Dojkabacteria bacterium]|uniref:N-acetylmuramoyl-L-alanine amidase n=1 Tax=Candidatus Dojkabacteria bacterium TaxID=2099670 RepID=A0A955RJS5_9BACT|nr:N-acetylmuramoyl-L-alanine amidase [Candidatus Dojkabacteria bacterium]